MKLPIEKKMRFCFLGRELFEDGDQLSHVTDIGRLQLIIILLSIAVHWDFCKEERGSLTFKFLKN